MSLLTIVQKAAVRFGIASPGSAASSTDQNIQQIVAFVNEAGEELAARHKWQALTKEATFTTLAAESQGTITSLTGTDFAFIVNETLWNRTQRRPIFGPKTNAEWQQLEAQLMQGPWQQYRIRGGKLLFLPAPPAGQSVYFEWLSNAWATDSGGTTPKSDMTVDTDVSLLDERLLLLETVWRFKAAKKLGYAEDYEKAEAAIADAISRDSTKAVLNMGGASPDIFPAVVVPAGNWFS